MTRVGIVHAFIRCDAGGGEDGKAVAGQSGVVEFDTISIPHTMPSIAITSGIFDGHACLMITSISSPRR